jgi:hypothetical protein
VYKFGVNVIQQARAIRKICGWFGIVDAMELTFLRNCFIEVACRESGTNDFFLYSSSLQFGMI